MAQICPPVTADTNRTSLVIAQEDDDCWGADPEVGALAPKSYEVRMTGETLVHNKATVVSESIRTDRMRDTLSEVGVSVEGDINFELSFRDWEPLLEGALANDFVYLIERTFAVGDVGVVGASNRYNVLQGAVDFVNFIAGADVWVFGFELNTINNGRMLITAVDIGDTFLDVDNQIVPVTNLTDEDSGSGLPLVFKSPKGVFFDLEINTADTISSVTTDFLVDVNLEVGQTFRMEGWDIAGNNGTLRITAISANLLTVTLADGSASTLATESAGQVTLTAQRLKNGILRKSFVVEKFFGDVVEFLYMTGCRVGAMTMNVEAAALVTGTFTFMGKEAVSQQVTVMGTRVPAGIQDALNATTNVGNLEEGDAPLATAVRSVEFTTENNLRQKPEIGSRSPVDIGYGFVDVTGTLTAYFEDNVLLQKFLQHSESQFAITFTDSDSNVFVITLPRLFFSSGTPTAPSGNDDVLLPMEFTAVRSPDDDAVIIIDALPAAL